MSYLTTESFENLYRLLISDYYRDSPGIYSKIFKVQDKTPYWEASIDKYGNISSKLEL